MSSNDSAIPTLMDQFNSALTWGRRLALAVTGMCLVLFIAQGAWLYQTAAAIHPLAGVGSLLLMGAGITLVIIPAREFFRMPVAVRPPAIPSRGAMNLGHLAAEIRYLDRYLSNCRRNPEFASKTRAIDAARTQLAQLLARSQASPPPSVDPFDVELTAWVKATIPPILSDLDRKADRLIYQESLTVGLATAASPNGTLDAFVMLWRGVRLVSQLASLYYGRPGLWGTLAICRDVSVATAFAGYLQNVTDSLGTVLARSAGGMAGLAAAPAVDGVTNALVLIRIGYLARERCRSFRQWDTAEQRSALITALAATQKVAVGLTTEILRQATSRLGQAAGAMAGGIGRAGAVAADKMGIAVSVVVDQATDAAATISDAAEQVCGKIRDLHQSLQDRFFGRAEPPGWTHASQRPPNSDDRR